MDSRCLKNRLLKLKNFQEFFKRHDTLLMYHTTVLTYIHYHLSLPLFVFPSRLVPLFLLADVS